MHLFTHDVPNTGVSGEVMCGNGMYASYVISILGPNSKRRGGEKPMHAAVPVILIYIKYIFDKKLKQSGFWDCIDFSKPNWPFPHCNL